MAGQLAATTGLQNFTSCPAPTAILSLLNQLVSSATPTSILLKGPFQLGLHRVWISSFFRAHVHQKPYLRSPIPYSSHLAVTLSKPANCSLKEDYSGRRRDTDMGHLAGPSLRFSENFPFSINGNTCSSVSDTLTLGPSPFFLMISLPLHPNLITPYKCLSDLSSPFSFNSHPISKALKIFLDS